MTEIRQYRVHLAAMMSLVIEEVRHGQLPRPADLPGKIDYLREHQLNFFNP